MRIDVDLYELKVDVGMLLMHPKCPNILPNWMVPKVLDRTSYVMTDIELPMLGCYHHGLDERLRTRTHQDAQKL